MDHSVEAANVFDRYARQYLEKFGDYRPYLDSYQRFLERLPARATEILDVACGPGNYTRFLLDNRPELRITGIDLAPSMVEVARSHCPDADFHVMDCREISTFNRKFDAIILSFCIPYLSSEQAIRLLQDTARLLNSPGLVYLSAIEGNPELSGYRPGRDEDRIFLNYYTCQYLIEQLAACGLTVIDSERKPYAEGNGETMQELFLIITNEP